ncbi:MAG: LacI family transcriptional regulator [Actinobacteria bacterium]|nr:LacI family transcriptional regulator [Actinomycetota bacterium]
MKRVKLEDIAKLLNISESTVSRALSNDEMISKKTRERVFNAARKLNYLPNLIAKSLKKKESGIFGLVIGDITNPFYIEMIKGVEDTANKHNKNIILTHSDQNPVKEINNLNILYSRQVDGIVITSLIGKHSIDFLKRINIPSVLVDIKPIPNFPANYVYTDGETAGYIGTKHLIENGHKKIALVNGPEIVSSSKQLETGYLKALKEYKITFNPRYLFNDKENLKISGGYETMKKIIELKDEERPTGILFIGDNTAIGAYDAIFEKGLEIPKHFSLVGYDDIYFSKYLSPPLTTISQSKYELGSNAMNLLLEKIKQPGFSEIKMIPELILRKSTTSLSHQ